jgi:hypothetical protein
MLLCGECYETFTLKGVQTILNDEQEYTEFVREQDAEEDIWPEEE